MEEIKITVEVDGKVSFAYRNIGEISEDELKQRVDSLVDAVRRGAHEMVGLEYNFKEYQR